MLMTMRAQTEAMRALVVFTAGSLDRAKRHPDSGERARHQALVDLLTPVVKAWCTDMGCAVASTGIQVHGGLGFIEATGAAQHYRDGRIAPIYEGTNGIQAIDLVGRKLMRDRGASARALIGTMRTSIDAADSGSSQMRAIVEKTRGGIGHLARATDWLTEAEKAKGLAGATPYLALFGTTVGGWLLARSALAAHRRQAAGRGTRSELEAKQRVAGFYVANLLPQAEALASAVIGGSDAALSLAEDQF
jgi:hypothetical protein